MPEFDSESIKNRYYVRVKNKNSGYNGEDTGDQY